MAKQMKRHVNKLENGTVTSINRHISFRVEDDPRKLKAKEEKDSNIFNDCGILLSSDFGLNEFIVNSPGLFYDFSYRNCIFPRLKRKNLATDVSYLTLGNLLLDYKVKLDEECKHVNFKKNYDIASRRRFCGNFPRNEK
ncbi:hypothetical protein ABEB36_009063 [Hypothenemus hampei]|uniref:Uncharacterized protein n=1 Tax=Hypothenemus hampei TaxID=57062 RepID=A0ABD1ENZ7_HYPHA